MEELIISILDRINSELKRCYWNYNQKEIESPFENTGTSYSNDKFIVRAYNWKEFMPERDLQPNFESENLKCWWYKQSHRGLIYELDDIKSISDLCKMLNEFLDAIRRDFGEYK